ncbi:acyl-CoA dehydrogenase family protein [Pseudorhodoferax sp. Leaf274]|uniref:acyl-CoA dehydrogenase family protein n=1 Tax=Pseudorhodoferax sp. Leaf274 TaxID=1736318 RepID=UPI000703A563|nr:acyl-CoA dehydrogenase family protein [Pseudorhodoferax sp. Leaf274]KQP36379.1 acyl-CoA dehydrogenase [Pseudorhodoferax sp. Leaf274]
MNERTFPSDEERGLLRDAVRRLLERHWPVDQAVELSRSGPAVRTQWKLLAEQGVAALGTDPSEGGMREIVLVMEELGRAASPAPVLSAALLNLLRLEERDTPLAAMRAGDACVVLAMDGADAAPALTWAGNRLSGEIAYVEAAHAATHFALLVPGPAVVFVQATAEGVHLDATPAMGTEGLHRLRLDGVAGVHRPLPAGAPRDLAAWSRLGLSGRAWGAAQRAFALVVDYAKIRRQFGQAIGSFQAIQHKLANVHIALQGLQLCNTNAALQCDLGTPQWHWFSAAAWALAGSNLRLAMLEIQHTFGAIGYSEEHEAPRHFKQVHLDVLRHGGGRRAREELAAFFLDGEGGTLPEYDLGEAGNAFRHEVRAWLAENWAGHQREAHEKLSFKKREYNKEFAQALGRTGWVGLSWPRRFGGQERSALEQIAFVEEVERVDAPRVGAPVQAAILQVYGTPEQQQRLLPEILRGEAIYGMGYSEPDAGSDLASMRTRAERVHDEKGDGWLINGQKIWTTTYWGDYMLLAARTDPDAKPRHAGLSLFIVPMDTPGITIKTSTTMYGGSFANVFYDNLRLPADAIVGEVNGGWKALTGALATERGLIGGGIVMKVARAFELLCAHVRTAEAHGRPLRDDALVRDRIGDLAAQIEAGRQMMMHCASQVDGGETPLQDAAVSKVYSGELMERFGEAALDILGMVATLGEGSPGAILRGRIEQNLRHALMWAISIGTNEIQRSLIAQRGLGLPR